MEDDQPTCGKGLAEHSAIPAALGALSAALAENLEVHMTALDLTDEHSRAEHDAYRELAAAHRDIAARLEATAGRMAGYRDLPMGRHDDAAMAVPRVLEVFESFVQREEALLALLERSVERDRQMLAAARGGQ